MRAMAVFGRTDLLSICHGHPVTNRQSLSGSTSESALGWLVKGVRVELSDGSGPLAPLAQERVLAQAPAVVSAAESSRKRGRLRKCPPRCLPKPALR